MSITGRRRGSRYARQTTFSMTEDMYATITAAADEHGVTASRIIRDAVRRGLRAAIKALDAPAGNGGR